MANKLMYIPNNDTQKLPFFRLQLLVRMFGHSTKLTKSQIVIFRIKTIWFIICLNFAREKNVILQ